MVGSTLLYLVGGAILALLLGMAGGVALTLIWQRKSDRVRGRDRDFRHR